MEIRFLNKEDAPLFSALRKYSLKESPFAFSDSYEDEVSKRVSAYAAEIEPRGEPLESFTLGAFDDNNDLIGFVRYKRDPRTKARHRASLYSLYVKPEQRKQGIAKLLVLELIKHVESIPGIEQLQLSTIVSGVSLVRYYQNLGFKKMGGLIEKDLIINARYIDAWYMVKHLKQ